MDKATLTQWFMHIRSHAAKNYKRDGWDCFYECVDFADFVDTCERMKLDTVDKAFEEYREWCKLKAEQREEQEAEADSGW